MISIRFDTLFLCVSRSLVRTFGAIFIQIRFYVSLLCCCLRQISCHILNQDSQSSYIMHNIAQSQSMTDTNIVNALQETKSYALWYRMEMGLIEIYYINNTAHPIEYHNCPSISLVSSMAHVCMWVRETKKYCPHPAYTKPDLYQFSDAAAVLPCRCWIWSEVFSHTHRRRLRQFLTHSKKYKVKNV